MTSQILTMSEAGGGKNEGSGASESIGGAELIGFGRLEGTWKKIIVLVSSETKFLTSSNSNFWKLARNRVTGGFYHRMKGGGPAVSQFFSRLTRKSGLSS